MKKNITILLVLLCFVLSPLVSRDINSTLVVSVENNRANASKLQGLPLDFLFEWESRIFIHLGLDELQLLENTGIPFRQENLPVSAGRLDHVAAQAGVNGAYHSYAELERDLLDLESSHPEIAKLFVLGQSLENRNIYALKISDNVQALEDEASVLFIGCHHAREWISVEVPFLIAEHLLAHYVTDPQVRSLVDSSQVWIVPLLNPDGLEYTIHFYRYWRKNRRNNRDGTYGVDLNRNYDFKWGWDNRGSSPDPENDVFRGPSSFSEPETQVIRDLCSEHDFQALVSYHSYSQVILFPWGYTTQPSEQNTLHTQLASEMSERMQGVNGRWYSFGGAGASLYLTNGDTTDWAFGTYGIPAFTIELPPVDQIHGGFFNAEADIDDIFRENLPAALFLLDWAIKTKPSAFSKNEEAPVNKRTTTSAGSLVKK